MTRRARRYPFPMPDWPNFRDRSVPVGLIVDVAQAFPQHGLPVLLYADRTRLEVALSRFCYAQDWP